MSEDNSFSIRAEERDELYVLLASREENLNTELQTLKRRLEADLYNRYSIAEMERVIQRVRDVQSK